MIESMSPNTCGSGAGAVGQFGTLYRLELLLLLGRLNVVGAFSHQARSGTERGRGISLSKEIWWRVQVRVYGAGVCPSASIPSAPAYGRSRHG